MKITAHKNGIELTSDQRQICPNLPEGVVPYGDVVNLAFLIRRIADGTHERSEELAAEGNNKFAKEWAIRGEDQANLAAAVIEAAHPIIVDKIDSFEELSESGRQIYFDSLPLPKI